MVASSSRGGVPLLLLLLVALLSCLVAVPVSAQAWSWSASVALASTGEPLAGTPVISSADNILLDAETGWSQNVTLPAAAANQALVITFVVSNDQTLADGSTSATFTAPAASDSASFVETYHFSQDVDEFSRSTDFSLFVRVAAPSNDRSWTATVRSPGDPASLASSGGATQTITYPFTSAGSDASVVFALASFAKMNPSLEESSGALTFPLPAVGASDIYTFSTTSQSGATSQWSVRFEVEAVPAQWNDAGWTAVASGGATPELMSSDEGNQTFLWTDADAHTTQSITITPTAAGAVLIPAFGAGKVTFTLGGVGESGNVPFKVRAPSGLEMPWNIKLSIPRNDDGGGGNNGGASSSSSSTGGGGSLSSSSSSTGDTTLPPDDGAFEGAASSPFIWQGGFATLLATLLAVAAMPLVQ